MDDSHLLISRDLFDLLSKYNNRPSFDHLSKIFNETKNNHHPLLDKIQSCHNNHHQNYHQIIEHLYQNRLLFYSNHEDFISTSFKSTIDSLNKTNSYISKPIIKQTIHLLSLITTSHLNVLSHYDFLIANQSYFDYILCGFASYNGIRKCLIYKIDIYELV